MNARQFYDLVVAMLEAQKNAGTTLDYEDIQRIFALEETIDKERVMRTAKERAQDFVSSGKYSPSLKECYIAGAAEEHLLLTHWNDIEADKDGFQLIRLMPR